MAVLSTSSFWHFPDIYQPILCTPDACRELDREREKIVFIENEIQRADVETTKRSNITSNVIYWIKANDGELRG